jgi:cell division septation protein DedD
MSKTDGEYELVLGNRQLLSAFFIIVILFGVFFTMGYVVGRNSVPAAEASVAAPSTTAGAKPDAAAPAPSRPAVSEPASVEKQPAAVETKPPETVPAAKKADPPPVHAAPEERQPVSSSKSAESPSASVPAINPSPGRMYLQVAAAGQPQASAVVETLKQKGFPALLSAGPRPDLYRVLVGPFADASTLGKAKSDLESAGFRPIVRK